MMVLKYIATIFIILGIANASFPLPRGGIASDVRGDSAPYRLPQNVRPLSYRILLEPNLEAASFDGTVEILVEALVPSNNITLHVSHITLRDVSVTQENSVDNILLSYEETNDDKMFLILDLTEDLVAGNNYVVAINYTGILGDDMEGFYLARYQDDSGVTRLLATTQFESVGARRAFPSFDEPGTKSTFRIEIIRAADYNSDANMKLESSTPLENGKVLDVFEESVMMSTYLVAFVVSDFVLSVEGRQGILARSSAILGGQDQYAFSVSEPLMQLFEDFAAMPYSIDKMDQAAIPNNYFSAGAMENWGLVTYRERYLLFEEDVSSEFDRMVITTIISHEFAHQWFGNIVSPSWWMYLWLNEGFATYFEYHMAAKLKPEWNLEDDFVSSVVQYAMIVDSNINTRAMSTDVGSRTEIESLFDAISYDKSGSIVRMWRHILSEEVFQDGLRKYLADRQFSAAVPGDLYSGFQQAITEAGIDVLPEGVDAATVMESWELQAGYPLITVSYDLATKTLKCTQKRYLTNGNDDTTKYYVPINYYTAVNDDQSITTPDFWLTDWEVEQPIDDELTENDWILINKQSSGYYRANYEISNWKKIIAYLRISDNINRINPSARAQLVDDAFALAQTGHLDYSIPLELSLYLTKETNAVPITSFINIITRLSDLLEGTSSSESFKSYVTFILQGALSNLGFDETPSDSHVDKLKRAKILTALCKFNDECKREASYKFKKWMTSSEGSNPIAPDLESVYYCMAINAGQAIEWNFLFENYKKSSMESSRLRALQALGCSNDINILKEFMDKVVNEDSVNISDKLIVFEAILDNNKIGVNAVIDYVMQHFQHIINTKGLGNRAIKSIIYKIGSKSSTADIQVKLNTLKKAHPEYLKEIDTALSVSSLNLKHSISFQRQIDPFVRTLLF